MQTPPKQSFLNPRHVWNQTPINTFMKLFFVAVLISASVSQLHAALDFYDSFNYSSTDVQLATAASPTWVTYAGGGIHPTNTSGSLSYPGLQTASGDNSVLFNGVTPGLTGIAARNLTQPYNIANTTTLYYSLTFRVNAITVNEWGNSAANYTGGSFMLGFNQKLQNGAALIQGDTAAPLLIRTGDPSNASGTANDFQSYQLGVGVTATTSNRVYDATHTYNPGDTLFLVLSYTFGSGVNDDVAKLYVNPVPGSLEGANTPLVTTTAGDLDVTSSQIQSFFLRNNSVEPNRTQVDDLRIGTTWADVTPAAPPSLRIERVSPNVLISWPTNNATGFLLQSNAVLGTASWGTVPNPSPVGDRFYITNGATSGNSFFRLRK
jgi:hypothetical protein